MAARYTHATTGAVVSVRDDKVLGSEWVADGKKAPAKKAAPKSDSK